MHLFALLFGASACSGPFAVFPGGALDGPVKPTPASFAFARDAGTVQLETRPSDPYSVNISCAVVGDELYVSAGSNRAEWAANMDADPNVRMRIDGDVYELAARRVTDRTELQAFADEWTKNAWARDPMQFDEVWVYHLGPR